MAQDFMTDEEMNALSGSSPEFLSDTDFQAKQGAGAPPPQNPWSPSFQKQGPAFSTPLNKADPTGVRSKDFVTGALPLLGAIGGASVGAVAGAVGGPPGAFAGGVAGATAGAAAGEALRQPLTSTPFNPSEVAKSGLEYGAGEATGLLAIKGAVKLAQKLKPSATAIMNRIARIHPSDEIKFKNTTGVDVGTFLTERNIFGDEHAVLTKLSEGFLKSKSEADMALSKIRGKWTSEPLDSAIEELAAREARVSSPGAPSRDLKTIIELQGKNAQGGLTMEEVNTVKRAYERNVKLDFAKTNNPEGVARATNIDNALREWQFDVANRMGLKNLPDINKETQANKMLLDALGKKLQGSSANNLITLTDWVTLAGGTPANLSMFAAKKLMSSAKLQAAVAKYFAPAAKKVGGVRAKTEPLLSLPEGKGGGSSVESGRTITLPENITKTNLGTEGMTGAKMSTEPYSWNPLLLGQGKSGTVAGPTIPLPAAGNNPFLGTDVLQRARRVNPSDRRSLVPLIKTSTR